MARVLMAGFETGDFKEIASAGTESTIESTIVTKGGYSCKFTTRSPTSSLTPINTLNAARYRIKTSIYLPSGAPASNTGYQIFNPWSASSTVCDNYLEHQTDGTLWWAFSDINAASTYTQITGWTFDQWHTVELDIQIGAGTGSASLYIDGTLLATLSSKQLGAANITQIFMGWCYGTTGRNYYYDDIEVDDAALCGLSYVIARQLEAGTPTYNTWTKVGGTNINDVWNDTPVNATTNANSGNTTSARAQTGLVSGFDSTQTGHGTGIIGANDNIAGIKVGLVAKTSATSSGGSSGNIRRRFNGADTDTAITLTTGDVYYQTPIFTDTFANLNASEIGFNKPSTASARTQTVEDVWIIVSYIPIPTTQKIISITSGHAINLNRMVQRKIVVTGSHSFSLQRSISKTVSFLSAEVARCVKAVTPITPIQITQGMITSLTKSAQKIVTWQSAMTVLFTRIYAKNQTLAVVSPSTISLPRSLEKYIRVQSAESVRAIKAISRSIAITAMGQIVSVTKAAQKIIAMQSTSALSFMAIFAKNLILVISTAQSNIIVRSISRFVRVTGGQSFIVFRALIRSINSAHGMSMLVFKKVGHIVIDTPISIVVTMRNSISIFVRVSWSQSQTLTRNMEKKIIIASAESVRALKSIPRSIFTVHGLTVPNVYRMVGHYIAIQSDSLLSYVAEPRGTIKLKTSERVSVIKEAAKRFQFANSVITTFARTKGVWVSVLISQPQAVSIVRRNLEKYIRAPITQLISAKRDMQHTIPRIVQPVTQHFVRVPGRMLKPAIGQIVTIRRGVSKVFLIGWDQAVSVIVDKPRHIAIATGESLRLIRSAGKRLVIQTGESVSAIGRAVRRALIQTGHGISVRLSRSMSKPIGLTLAETLSLRRAQGKAVRVETSERVTLRRALAIRISTVGGQFVSVRRSISRLLTLTGGQIVAVTRAVSKPIIVRISHSLTLTKNIATIIRVTWPVRVSMARVIRHYIAFQTGLVASAVKAISRRVLISQPQAVAIAIGRRVKTISLATATAIGLQARNARYVLIEFTQPQAIRLRKSVDKLIRVTSALRVTLVKTASVTIASARNTLRNSVERARSLRNEVTRNRVIRNIIERIRSL